jgi:hypothetical protein
MQWGILFLKRADPTRLCHMRCVFDVRILYTYLVHTIFSRFDWIVDCVVQPTPLAAKRAADAPQIVIGT